MTCYQCGQPVNYLFADGRGKCCTRLTPEEVSGARVSGRSPQGQDLPLFAGLEAKPSRTAPEGGNAHLITHAGYPLTVCGLPASFSILDFRLISADDVTCPECKSAFLASAPLGPCRTPEPDPPAPSAQRGAGDLAGGPAYVLCRRQPADRIVIRSFSLKMRLAGGQSD